MKQEKNLQQNISLKEEKWAVSMLASRQNGESFVSVDLVGKKLGKSGRQIHRHIRLTELIYQLLDKVDAGIITPTAGAEISFLDTRNQAVLNDYIEKEDSGVSIKQAKQVRECYEKAGVSIKNMQMLLGHADTRTLLETYTHIDFEDKKSSIDAIEKSSIIQQISIKQSITKNSEQKLINKWSTVTRFKGTDNYNQYLKDKVI